MSLIDKLPLIRGWSWRNTPLTVVALANQEILAYSPPTPSKEIGWVVSIDLSGNDAYLGLRIVMPGVDTAYATFAVANAIGAMLPPPSGTFLLLYNQPNPLRTIGQYVMSIITSAYPYPFLGAVRIYISLRPGTTEPFAVGAIGIGQIIIQDRNLFLQDLRKILYGRWAPLMDLISHIPLLRRFVMDFENFHIPFEEKEVIEPPGLAR